MCGSCYQAKVADVLLDSGESRNTEFIDWILAFTAESHKADRTLVVIQATASVGTESESQGWSTSFADRRYEYV